MSESAILALADGRIFRGRYFGASRRATGEVVFNTAMTGYQEIITDPSYKGQIVAMTYPHIGNYGVNTQDAESRAVHAAGMIVRDAEDVPSSWRSQMSLSEYLVQAGVAGLTGIDTRALTRHIRKQGAVNGVIGPADADVEALVSAARDIPPMQGRNLVDEVTCEKPYEWSVAIPGWDWGEGKDRLRCVVMDFGAKHNIMRALVSCGFEVTVVPARTSASDILNMDPHAVMLSNGPGDPAAVDYAIGTISDLLGKRPIFGVCLGHQLLSLALGLKTFKLKFGHHGANHPVKDLATGHIAITSQNHGFCVDPASVDDKTRITHINLYDEAVEGIERTDLQAFSVQYHPEAAPGPWDSRNLFERFRAMVEAS